MVLGCDLIKKSKIYFFTLWILVNKSMQSLNTSRCPCTLNTHGHTHLQCAHILFWFLTRTEFLFASIYESYLCFLIMVNNLIILSANRYSRAALKVISENGNNLMDCSAIFMRYGKTGEEDGF